QEAVDGLNGPLGNDVMTKVARDLGLRDTAYLVPVLATPAVAVAPLADYQHRMNPPWPIQQHYKAKVTASVYYRKNVKKLRELGALSVPKHVWLRFALKTNASSPYQVSWQVVNTGVEASAARQLRGDFY